MAREMTDTERLIFIKDAAIRAIRTHSQSVKKYLEDVRDTSVHRLAQLEVGNGQALAGAFNLGPLGHQLPADVNSAAIRLKEAIDYAHMAGATDDEIKEAQKGWGL